jgi:hypothetical protein
MRKSIDQLRDEYIAAIDARSAADTRVKALLLKHDTGPQHAAEWNAALEADYAAEQKLKNARDAYQAATPAGEG